MTQDTAIMTARAFALDSFDAPGSIREVPVRAPGDGEMVIRVHAAGINPMDLSTISGALKEGPST